MVNDEKLDNIRIQNTTLLMLSSINLFMNILTIFAALVISWS